MRLLALLLVLLVVLSGCSGKEEKVETAETPKPEKTPVTEKTPEKKTEVVVEEGEINTLLDLFNAKKMYYVKATISEEGAEKTMEFWFYYDANNNEQKMRMQNSEGEVVIIKHKYEGNTLTTTMYVKNAGGINAPQNCDWVEIKTTQEISPGEAEDVKSEPVGDAFKTTVTQQGKIVEKYEAKFVDLDLSLFETHGNVCSISMMMQR
ncbi:conserved hypothetical protein [Ferroglobus placidus DSM 10642]|uniref:Uncharacterized protein n=1 Tax=Ferroglobus placidus (strain DSM 10642 / AEDII12DO) TaxID=589924 RepID=D3S006_FERPA|nr:hypothetical protein [Ferroglobus placidus]ADC66069.1 conserved hypothetical protein [Ferroglobus placidus DSM 10642]